MSDLRKAIQQLKFQGRIAYNEPLSGHTSFEVGGPADVFLEPKSAEDVAEVVRLSNSYPVFVLGAGANILVSDLGIRGIVVSMTAIDSLCIDNCRLIAGAGAEMSSASRKAADCGLSGLEFIYSMPGSVGGSVWMNARCYGTSVSDILLYADVIDQAGQRRRIEPDPSLFDYKVSPFQSNRWIIVEAGFRLYPGVRGDIESKMLDHEKDRTRKGHFAYPSAGSVYKNNRAFGEPTGKIIDRLGLRGTSRGGAKISDLHANIIVNTGGATANDIRELMAAIEEKVEKAKGFELEREVRLVGEWPGLQGQMTNM